MWYRPTAPLEAVAAPSLLYAFASLETNVLNNVDLAAKLLSYRLNVLANRYLIILNECLLKEAVLRIVFANLTVDDLVLNLLRLVSHLRIFSHLSQHDLSLLVKSVSR